MAATRLRAHSRWLLLLLGLLLTSGRDAVAQHLFDTWTTENGLPQNSVNDILQTRDGYLWLATFGGLVRFDGVRFVVFDRSVEGIGSQRLRTLHQDRTGTLWAGSEDGMLIRYRNGRFATYARDAGLPHAAAVRIEEDGEGRLWVTWVGVVTKYDGNRFVNVGPNDFGDRVKPPEYPRHMDAWWSEEGGDLHVLVAGRVRTYAVRGELGGTGITGVKPDRAGNLWISTNGAGVFKAEGDRLEQLTTREGLPTNSPNGFFSESHGGDLWFFDARNVFRIRHGEYRRVTIPGAPASGAVSLLVDREGSAWIGTTASGVHRFNDVAFTLLDERDRISLRIAYAILEDRVGAIWISTNHLHRLANGRLTSFTYPDSNYFPVTCLYEDAAGTLWVGTAAGLRYLHQGRLQAFADPSGFLSGSIWALVQDRSGTYWYATENGVVRSSGGQFRRFTTVDGLAHDRVSALFEDRRGTMWIGTFQGLTRWRDGVFTSYTERDGFIGNAVRAFHEDSNGILWIGTYDGGLYRLTDDRLTRYTRAEGLHDNGVFQILEDDDGYFWMGSNRGIQRVSRRALNDLAEGRRRSVVSVAFGARDGLASVEVNGGRHPSGLRTDDGRLWFPTMGGVAVIDPRLLRTDPPLPPAIIEEFRHAGQALDMTQGIEVGPESATFEITYTAPSFVRPEQVRFRHRLRGLHDDWIEAGHRREASFHRIPPGRYTFEVAAAGRDGVWGDNVASLGVVVLPPFWRTRWFVALALTAVVGLALGAHQLRVRRLRRLHALGEAFSRRLIDSQENERRRISNEMHDSLGQDLRIVRRLARHAREHVKDDDQSAEAFDEIAAVAERVQSEMTEMAYGLRPHQLDTLGLSKTIDSMIRRVEQVSDVRFTTAMAPIDDLVPEAQRIHVFRIVQEAVSNVVEHAEATQATVSIVREAGQIRISIEDNGRGFDAGAERRSPSLHHGFGLVGMRERSRILGGRVDIRSAAGTGTQVIVTLAAERAADG